MPTTKQETIGICLFELPDKDQAVIQRVITFGASQGKNYAIESDIANALVMITLDHVQLPVGSQTINIRIGEAGLPCDLLLQRPLLVTRVMRALDDAAHMLTSSHPSPIEPQQQRISEEAATESIPSQTVEPESAGTTASPETELAEQPALSNSEKTNIASHQGNTKPVSSSLTESNIDRVDSYEYTALVVDDSAAIRKQLEIELRDAQIKAEFAETGEEALEKSSQKQYDLIFLDIIMPGIDGYEVCRQMRARKTMKKTPIIMLSGKTSPLDEVQGVIAGASTYLTKPVKHEQFQQTLKRVSKWLTNFAC